MENEFLQKAIREAEKLDLKEQVPNVTEYPYTVSERFKKQIQKLIKKQRKPYFYLINTAGKRVACIVAVIVVLMTTTVMSVEALRTPFVNFFVEVFETFTSIVFETDDETVPTTIETEYAPTYIPDGYSVVSVDRTDTYVKIKYQNIDGEQIMFIQNLFSDLNANIDSEKTKLENISLNKFYAIFYTNKNTNNLIWDNKNYSFCLFSKINKDELIKIANSTKS